MRLSLLELPTLVRRALLVAGLPRGVVDTAARMVAWAEIERGDGLAFLESHLPEIAGAVRARPMPVRQTARACVLASNGASPLLWAPLVLDLATAAARREAVGMAHVPDGAEAAPLGWVADQAARRGLIALLAGPSGTWAALPVDGAIWRLEHAGRFPASVEAELPERTQAGLAAWLARPIEPKGAPRRGVCLLCADAAAFGAAAPKAALQVLRSGARVQPPDEAEAQRAAAMRDGVEVDAALWLRLRRFGDRVLVENSERSRQGAG